MRPSLLAGGLLAAFALFGAACECFSEMGDPYRCICEQTPPGGATEQHAVSVCTTSLADARQKAEASCSSACTCSCVPRDDTGACVIRYGKTCR